MIKDMTAKFFPEVNAAEADDQEIETEGYDVTDAMIEAVMLNPSAVDPDDIQLQMELDDFDDNGDPKSFDAWDRATDAYHNGNVKDWSDALLQVERDSEQINVHPADKTFEQELMSDEDQLIANQKSMDKYLKDRRKAIADFNANHTIFDED